MGGAPSLPGTLFQQKIIVGVGDLAVSNDANTVIATFALGSCVGLVLYDTVVQAGGLLHCMLPEASLNPKKAVTQPAMFADTGFTELLRLLDAFKVQRSRLKAFVAGGSSMSGASDLFRIGDRNSKKLKELLFKERIPILAEDLGGTHNRTLHFNVKTATIEAKISGVSKSYTFPV
jgi:chemotaxis protein CheD